MTLEEALWQDDDRMSGAVCFRGTRIPVSIFFEHLLANRIQEFREGYEGVSGEQIEAVIHSAHEMVDGRLSKKRIA